MKKIQLTFSFWGHKELKDYLLSLNGVSNVEIDDEKDLVIDFEYDEKIISPKILRYEVLAFMEVDYPSLICFNSYETGTKEYKIVVKDVCCEYCFMDMIEELFTMDGIVSAKSDYDEINHHYNINLYIKYNPNIIKEDDLRRIEEDFNN